MEASSDASSTVLGGHNDSTPKPLTSTPMAMDSCFPPNATVAMIAQLGEKCKSPEIYSMAVDAHINYVLYSRRRQKPRLPVFVEMRSEKIKKAMETSSEASSSTLGGNHDSMPKPLTSTPMDRYFPPNETVAMIAQLGEKIKSPEICSMAVDAQINYVLYSRKRQKPRLPVFTEMCPEK